MTATGDAFSAAGSGPLTVRDLERMLGDGRRYELIDGVLIVRPAPGTRHQTTAYRLYGLAGRPRRARASGAGPVYERLGVADYWVIDPAEPRLTAYHLVDGKYREAADVAGDEPFEARRPYPVRVVPSNLLGRFAD